MEPKVTSVLEVMSHNSFSLKELEEIPKKCQVMTWCAKKVLLLPSIILEVCSIDVSFFFKFSNKLVN